MICEYTKKIIVSVFVGLQSIKKTDGQIDSEYKITYLLMPPTFKFKLMQIVIAWGNDGPTPLRCFEQS